MIDPITNTMIKFIINHVWFHLTIKNKFYTDETDHKPGHQY